MVFDCLYGKGRWLIHEPFGARRRVLTEIVSTGGMVVVPDGVEGTGERYFEAVQDLGLEGVVAKRLDGAYRPGRRSPVWQKFLAYRLQWFSVVALSQSQDGSWYWSLVEQRDGRTRSVGRVRAPSSWRPHAGGAAPLTLPFSAEALYRERTREGHLRHARIRQWRQANSLGAAADTAPGQDSVSGDPFDAD
jgi:hypothetical protein